MTPVAAPLQDNSSLERRNPISLNGQGATQKDTEVLHSNFTAINLHHCEEAEGSGWWQPEGKVMGSDPGCIPFPPSPLLHTILCFHIPLDKLTQRPIFPPERHTEKFIYIQAN